MSVKEFPALAGNPDGGVLPLYPLACDESASHGIFPYRKVWTGRSPSVHHGQIRLRLLIKPFEKIENERFDVGHVASRQS